MIWNSSLPFPELGTACNSLTSTAGDPHICPCGNKRFHNEGDRCGDDDGSGDGDGDGHDGHDDDDDDDDGQHDEYDPATQSPCEPF